MDAGSFTVIMRSSRYAQPAVHWPTRWNITSGEDGWVSGGFSCITGGTSHTNRFSTLVIFLCKVAGKWHSRRGTVGLVLWGRCRWDGSRGGDKCLRVTKSITAGHARVRAEQWQRELVCAERLRLVADGRHLLGLV